MDVEKGPSYQENSRLDDVRARAVANLDQALQSPEESALREHQHTMLESMRDFFASGEVAGYLSEPTGVGKGAVIVKAAEAMGLRTVILSPTQPLLQQIKGEADKFTPGLSISNYYSLERDLSGQVTNTTYQSAVNLVDDKRRKTKEAQSFDPKEVELLVCDEAHLALGELRHTIFRAFPNALLIGMTATPDFSPIEGYLERGIVNRDERWLGMFQKNIHEMTIEEAMGRGILTREVDIDLLQTNVRVDDIQLNSAGEYRRTDLEKFFNTKARQAIVLALLSGNMNTVEGVELSPAQRDLIPLLHEKIKGKRTMVYLPSIDGVSKILPELEVLGITAAPFHGEVPAGERQGILDRHIQGEIPVLLGVDMLGLGINSPPTEVGIYARPTTSSTLLTQQLGRTLRPSPETGKDKAIAIQLVDTIKQPRQAPVLLPQIFDPEFIHRGTRTGRESNRTAPRSASAEKPVITVSGMKVDTILEQVRAQDLLRKRFTQADVTEASATIENIVNKVTLEHPDAHFYEIAKEVLTILPERYPREVYDRGLQAVASLDPNMQEKGSKLLMLLNLRTAVGLVDSYSTMYDSDDERDEMLQIAMVTIGDISSKLTNGTSVNQQVHLAVRKALVAHISERDKVPYDSAWEMEYPKLYSKIIGVVSGIQDTMTETEREKYIEALSDELDIPTSLISDILASRSTFEEATAEVQSPDEKAPDVVYDVKDLRDQLDSTLETLSERERQILEMRFGLDGNKPMTMEEIGPEFGLTRERIRQIEAKAFRKLRHPSRAKKIRDFLNEDVVLSLPQYEVDTPPLPPFDYSSSSLEGPPPGTVTSPGRTWDAASSWAKVDHQREEHLKQLAKPDVSEFDPRDPYAVIHPDLRSRHITDINQLFYFPPDELYTRLGILPVGEAMRVVTREVQAKLGWINELLNFGRGTIQNKSDMDTIYHVVEGVMERDDISNFELNPIEELIFDLDHGRIAEEVLAPEQRAALSYLGEIGQGVMRIEAAKKIFRQAYAELTNYNPEIDSPGSPVQ